MKPIFFNMNHKLAVLTAAVLALCLLLTACGKDKAKEPTDLQTETAAQLEEASATETGETVALLMPWEAEEAKQPQDYTLEEYEGLTFEQQKAFEEYLGEAGFAAWKERAETAAGPVEIPWKESGAKKPEDYSLSDYQALTPRQQKAFMEALGPQGLESWLQKVQGGNKTQGGSSSQGGSSQNGNSNQSGNGNQGSITIPGGNNVHGAKDFYPWEKNGAKKAENYTLEDYEALPSVQKTEFQKHLGSSYNSWLIKALEKEYPWLASGAKQPADYTWAEYSALKDNQKDKFQEKLGAAGFAEWMKNAMDQEKNNPWKKPGAKQPKDYTWAEYEALTQAQQTAFQEHLGEEGMKAWLRTVTDIPWEKPNAKKPDKYSLKEYENLNMPQKLAFRIHLGFAEFEAWLIEAKNPMEENPWDKAGAKQPKDYTWEDYSKLTAAQQMAFQAHLGNKGFDDWMKKVQGQPAPYPWDKAGATQPADYTWAEYNALSEAHQIAFQKHLGSGFDAWLNKVQEKPAEKPVVYPWDASGAKQPQDYTLAEFNELKTEQQMAFQKHLGSGFDAWLSKVQEKPVEKPAVNPWDEAGAKQPADYTWAEFNELTGDQQMAFQNHLGSGFEAWMNRAQEQEEVNPWDKPGAKQPQDYTMEEFDDLTGAQQIAFQKYLGSAGFEAWLMKALEKPEEEPTEAPTEEPAEEPTETPTEAPTEAPAEAPAEEASAASAEEPAGYPWEVPGARQPADYTWEEYDALTEEEKAAFRDFLGEEAFEAWLNQVQNS